MTASGAVYSQRPNNLMLLIALRSSPGVTEVLVISWRLVDETPKSDNRHFWILQIELCCL